MTDARNVEGMGAALPGLMDSIQQWARSLGFSQIGVAGVDLSAAEPGLAAWLAHGFHGGMGYMAAHGLKRARPAELVPGTVSVITARMNYLPRQAAAKLQAPDDLQAPDGLQAPGGLQAPDGPKAAAGWQAVEWARLQDADQASVSVYARGRDYHKVLRSRLGQLAHKISEVIGPFGHRVFTDSAPVLEVELASRGGIGWRGKHTLALHRDAGSMFFLGEIFVDLALAPTPEVAAHCGTCTACLTVCPTQAIVAPYRLDARRCISYLTIEHAGPIPPEFRRAIGNRIYGCDDCQLVCPWNKYAQRSDLPDFDTRPALAGSKLLAMWAWSEADFLRHTEGNAIRRIGFERWQRNLAVGLGNALAVTPAGHERRLAVVAALTSRRAAASDLVREHIDWALAQDPSASAAPHSIPESSA